MNPLARLVERWWPPDDRPEIITGVVTWLPDGVSHPLMIELHSIFCRRRSRTRLTIAPSAAARLLTAHSY